MNFQMLQPSEVLYRFGEPMIFTSEVDGLTMLCSKLDENEVGSLYISVMTSAFIVGQLKSGHVSLRDAFYQPICWIVQTDFRFRVITATAESSDRLPSDYFADAGFGLYPEHGMIEDRFYKRVPDDPFLSVKFEGRHLGSKTMPLGIFKHLLDEVYVSVRKVLFPVVQSVSSAPLSEAAMGKILRLPIREPEFASLSIEFEAPSVDISSIRKKIAVDNSVAGARMGDASATFVEDIIAFDNLARGSKLQDELPRASVSLDAVVELLPTDNTAFDTLIVGTRTRRGRFERVSVGVEEGKMIRDAYYNIHRDRTTIRGKIVEFNDLSDSFIIQDLSGRATTCVAPTKDIERAFSSYVRGNSVVVTGLFERRPRRDRIYVRHIEAATE